ncbi:YihY/virulence factor BrkB family protein [Pseudonocardia sp.]|uniref:YihY/virulence factor BrkB family protein n=1 Tax=Pseudonocardia sp. TaxID=60912 RepID=UPI003D12119C
MRRAQLRELARTATRVLVADQLVDRAAALTYFGLLAIVPGTVVLVALGGFFARSEGVQQVILRASAAVLPEPLEGIGPALVDAIDGESRAGTAAIIGLVVSVWAVSGYVAAFQRATAAIRDVPEDRAPWMAKLARLPLTLLLLALLSVITLMLVVGGPLVATIERVLGLPPVAAALWTYLRWPLLFVVLNVFFSLLQRGLPRSLRHVRTRGTWLSLGSVVAVTIWMTASAAFSLYVTTFASDHGGYGAFGTLALFLGWMWMGSFAMLVGVEVDVRIVEASRLRGVLRRASGAGDGRPEDMARDHPVDEGHDPAADHLAYDHPAADNRPAGDHPAADHPAAEDAAAEDQPATVEKGG